MALPVVLIDVPPEAPAPLVDVLVRACSHGLRRGECDTAAPSVGQVVATVTVSWSDPSHSCIILSVTSSQRAPEADRRSRICFGPADAPAERWRASGFAAATLAEPMVSAALVEPSAPRQPPTVPPPPEPPPPPDRWGSWLGLAVLAGPGFDDGVWRFGSRLRLSQTLAEGPLLATAGLHWTERGRQEPVAARWGGGAMGLGATSALDPVALGFSLELLIENLRVSSYDEWTGSREAGDRWVPGFLAGVDLRWPGPGLAALSVGGYAWRLRDGTTVNRFDEKVASWPAVGWSLAAGVEFRLR